MNEKSNIYIFDFDDEQICVDLDEVRTISFKESRIRITFKNKEISDLTFSSSQKAKDSFDKMIEKWNES